MIASVTPGFAKNRVGVYPVGMAVVEVKLTCEVGDGSCSGDGGGQDSRWSDMRGILPIYTQPVPLCILTQPVFAVLFGHKMRPC